MFKTTTAYVSGAICGNMWWPQALAGKPVQKDLRGVWGFMPEGENLGFEQALDSLLMREGGDFQCARFSADTVIRIERRAVDAPGKYRIHVKEIELAKLCPDLCNLEAYSGDFMGDCE